MMGVVAKDDRFPVARPGAFEIGDRILCLSRRHDARQSQYEDKISHVSSPLLRLVPLSPRASHKVEEGCTAVHVEQG
jgi:hypothetical protein